MDRLFKNAVRGTVLSEVRTIVGCRGRFHQQCEYRLQVGSNSMSDSSSGQCRRCPPCTKWFLPSIPQQRTCQPSSPLPRQASTSTSAPSPSVGFVNEPLPFVNSITRSSAVPPKSRKSDSPRMSLSPDDTPSQKQVRGPIHLLRLLKCFCFPSDIMHTFCIGNINEWSKLL